MISKQAVIHPDAKLADNVSIGPFTIIGPDVEIGMGTQISSHVVIKGPTKIGCYNRIFQFCSIGEDSQDKKYLGEKVFLEIGDNNTFREYCSVHRGTIQDKGLTRIGNDNLFLAYVHIAHDCFVANNTIFSNSATLGGHVHVGDYAVLGGLTAVHQFCKIGQHSFSAGGAIVINDVLPYITVCSGNARAVGLNSEGLSRRGFSKETVSYLKRAYKIIYCQNLMVKETLPELQTMTADCPEIQNMINFIKTSVRGIVRPRRTYNVSNA